MPARRHLAFGLLAGFALVVGVLAPAASAAADTPARTTSPATVPGEPGPASLRAADPVPAGSVGIRLLDAPESAGADPRARQYVVDHVAPGTVIERRVEISNTTTAPTTVGVYSAAASIVQAEFTPAPGRTPDELSTWIRTDKPSVTVGPQGTAVVLMTIAVPRDAAPGEQYAALWAEQSTAAPAGGGVTLVNRVGVRVYLSVGPGNPPPSAFTVDTLTAERSPDGRPVVQAQLRNTGGRALDLSGELRLSDGPGGLVAGPFPASLGTTVAPGDTEPVSVALDGQLPNGPWQAQITLRSGLTEENAQASIEFPAATGSSGPVSTGTGVPTWALAAAGGLIVVLLVVVVLLLRRRRPSGPAT